MKTLDEIRPKIKALEVMPTIPTIIHPLAAMMQMPADRVDLAKVIELVSYDSTIAAQCLRMANSPLFGRRNTDNIRSALVALGLKRVQAILLGCCLSRIVPPDKWALDAISFWRHSLACALVSSKMAHLIAYPDPEKAYLAGLLHDLGILVNSTVFTEDFRGCVEAAHNRHVPLHIVEQEFMGFTHCESGKILAEQWHFSADIVQVVELHHFEESLPVSQPLVSLVHITDLLCRLRDLGYGYYETMGIDLVGEAAWDTLVRHYPALANMDLARLTLDIDGAMDEIVGIVDAVFAHPYQAA